MPRVTSFNVPEDLYVRLNVAAASLGQSSSEYIRNALYAALQGHARSDPVIAAAFRVMDERRLADVAEDARMQRELSQRINGEAQ